MDQRGRNELVSSYIFDHRIAINLWAGYKSRNVDVGEMRNPIFVWCCTMETEPDVILSTWKDLDSVVEVTDPLAFAERVKNTAVARKPEFLGLQVGPVTYNKDRGSHRAYHLAEGVFQKNIRFNG